MKQVYAAFVTLLLLVVPARGGDLPDPNLTPGLIRSGLSLQQICTNKWGQDARHVTDAMKRQIFLSYGLSGNDDRHCVPDAHGRRCEIDHLISRELGGADDVKNLWPQPYGTHLWNAVLKDRVENRLHKEVCAHRITLKKAQQEIATDWAGSISPVLWRTIVLAGKRSRP
jgi:hypothetical protein